MGSTLTMEPINRKKQNLSYELKRCFQRKCAGCVCNKILDECDIPYLKGLLDAGVEDAQIVIDYIEKYEEVIINEEF